MTRKVWLTLGLVLVVVGGSAAALDVVSDPIAVWDDDVNNRVTDVVYNPQHDEYLILFHNIRAASIDIYARRVAGDGTVLSWFAVVSGAGEKHVDARASYCPTQDEYLVAWTRQQDTGTKDDVLARTVFWNGSSMGPIFAVVADVDHQRAPDVAYNQFDDEYLVVYHNQWGGGLEDVAAQRIRASDRAFLSWANIATGSPDRHYPRVAYLSEENTYLIAYTLEQKGVYAKLALANLAGVSVAPEIVIRFDPGILISWPIGVAAGPGGYLVAWKEVDPARTSVSARARHVNPAGVPPGPANGFLVSDSIGSWSAGDRVSVSSGLYGNFMVVWSADHSSISTDVEGAVVGPESNTTSAGPLPVSNETLNQFLPALDCAMAGACLVAYTDDFTQGVQADFDVRARLFRPVVFADRFETGDVLAWSNSVP
ncbi:hypothetical protein N9980_00450 [bacterium]|nr:hypothetical protein [bacterium]